MNGNGYPVERIELPVGEAPLFLRRGLQNRDGAPVLFLHGGSASGDTFLEPRGHSIFDFLSQNDMDVWLLDWRGSHYVTAKAPGACNEPGDTVAAKDIPAAVDYIRRTRQAEGHHDKIAVVGHCVGAACLAMAIGAGYVSSDSGLGPVTFSTVGLFYEVTWDGWSKVQDRILDRLADVDETIQFITPDVNVSRWPDMMEDTFQMWPGVWGPPPPWDVDFFRRLAFMYGQAFLVSNLHERMTQDVVRGQFGAIPFKLYRHAAQNALRGFAAPFNEEGRLHRDIPNEEIPAKLAEAYIREDAFKDLQITLITGAENPLWHRESIDRMAEWLDRHNRTTTKHVLTGYGHQDLWWGRGSRQDVFPLILKAVKPVAA